MIVPTTGLLAWYECNETASSAQLRDSHVNRYHSTSAVNSPGVGGVGMDGYRICTGTQYFVMPTDYGLGAVGQAMSVFLRVHTLGDPGGNYAFLGAQSAAAAQIMQIDVNAGCIRAAYGTGGFDVLTTGATVTINTTYSIAFTLTTAGVGNLYINGAQTFGGTLTDAARTGSFSEVPSWYIGAINSNGSATSPMNARLWDIGIWNVALSASTVAGLHTSSIYGDCLAPLTNPINNSILSPLRYL